MKNEEFFKVKSVFTLQELSEFIELLILDKYLFYSFLKMRISFKSTNDLHFSPSITLS